MIKRSELNDTRMKYTAKEIALYNAKAYNRVAHSMQLIIGQEKWVPPDIKDVKDE